MIILDAGKRKVATKGQSTVDMGFQGHSQKEARRKDGER